MDKQLEAKKKTYAYVSKMLENMIISNEYYSLLEKFKNLYYGKYANQNFYKTIKIITYFNKRGYLGGNIGYKKVIKDISAMYVGEKIKYDLERIFSRVFLK